MRKFWKDRSGSSLVMVLITMTFLTLLAMAIITMTITNIWMKASQKKSQVNFYQTDSVLDSISAGIKNTSSNVSANAYAMALSDYNASLSANGTSLDDKYTSSYIEEMIKALSGAYGETFDPSDLTRVYHYDDDVIKSYLTDEEVPCYKLNDGTADGSSGTMVIDGESIILQGVKVWKQENDYRTDIETDIRVEVPLVNTDAHSQYLAYAILADDQIVAGNSGSTLTGPIKNVVINGNIYAGTVNRDETNSAKYGDDVVRQQGIVINNSGQVTVNAEYIITRGDIAVSGNSSLNVSASAGVSSHIWAENILTGTYQKGNYQGGNTLDIQGYTYVSDDLELNGDGDKVNLSGKYYGYNYNSDYSDPVKVAGKAQYSSAVSVNGKKDELDLSGLDALVLSGRTYISKKTYSNETFDGSLNPDIELGESLTYKASQLAYLVQADKSDDGSFVRKVPAVGTASYANYKEPAAYPGVGQVDSGSGFEDWWFFEITQNGTTEKYAFNDTAYTEFLGIQDTDDITDATIHANYQKYVNSVADTHKNAFGNADRFNIMDYLDEDQPIQVYYRNAKLSESAAPTIINYYYLKFKNRSESSNFYNVYFNCSPQEQVYDPINQEYLSGSGITLPTSSSQAILLSSGNMLYSTTNAGKLDTNIRIENNDTPSTTLQTLAQKYSIEYMSLQMSLLEDYAEAKNSGFWRLQDDPTSNMSKSGVKDSTNLFDVLISRADMPIGSKMPTTLLTDASGHDWKYVVYDGNTAGDAVVIDSNFQYGLVITTGDVRIEASSFTGLILAGGDVIFANAAGTTINSNEEMISKMLETDQAAATPAFYNLLSKYFRKSVDATIGNGNATDVDNVSYENWKRQ